MCKLSGRARVIVENATKRLKDLLESGGYVHHVVGETLHSGYVVKIGQVHLFISTDEVTRLSLHEDDWLAFLTCLGDHTNAR